MDSYEAIGEALKVTYAHYDLVFDEEWVMDFIIKESVKALLFQVAKEQELDFAELSAFFKKEQEAKRYAPRTATGSACLCGSCLPWTCLFWYWCSRWWALGW